jgi:hypothetical protein
VRRFGLALLLLAACKTPDPPGGFGVNLTIQAGQLTSELRSRIQFLKLIVRGESTPYEREVDAGRSAGASELRIRYVPGVMSGELGFHAVGLDAARAVVAATQTEGTVRVEAGRAVNLTLTLAAGDLPDMAAAPKKTQGEACTSSGECDTPGGCADGVCCNAACTESCRACNLAGVAGVCSPIAAGMAPAHGSCGPDLVATCQRDGTCDGQGACRLYPIGSVCRASTCNAGTNIFTPTSTCNGDGICTTPNARLCDPLVCKDGAVCYDDCTDNAQCKAPNTCDVPNASCGPKPDGANCSNGNQCASTFCVEGVCCENSCAGTCKTCKLVEQGKCRDIPDGQDPEAECPAGAGSSATCTPGGCNGAGACRRAAVGTACAAACIGTTPSNTVCDSAGECAQTANDPACDSKCQDCTLSGVTAACVNRPTTTVCTAASCSGARRFAKTYCNSNGQCPVQSELSGCGLYNCYIDFNADAACYTNCGCCSMFCLCGTRPANCVSGNCNSSNYTCF